MLDWIELNLLQEESFYVHISISFLKGYRLGRVMENNHSCDAEDHELHSAMHCSEIWKKCPIQGIHAS